MKPMIGSSGYTLEFFPVRPRHRVSECIPSRESRLLHPTVQVGDGKDPNRLGLDEPRRYELLVAYVADHAFHLEFESSFRYALEFRQ